MRNWSLMPGGLLIWTLHFLGVYAVASIADVSDPSMYVLWRRLGVAFTALCLLALIFIIWRSRSSTQVTALYRQVGLGACVVSFVAIVWQGVPLLVSA